MTADGPPELTPVDCYRWINVLEGVQWHTADVVLKMSPKHRPAARTIAGVSARLPWWCDPDGSNLRPSTARIAVACCVDIKTASAVLVILRELGLIMLVSRGGRGKASQYQLTVPSDLLDRVKRLTPAELTQRMRALDPPRPNRPPRSRRNTGGMPTGDQTAGPVDDR
ncbi:MAG TPA: hypothetical protein VI248_25635 [Kineosporiaceae bacterium]